MYDCLSVSSKFGDYKTEFPPFAGNNKKTNILGVNHKFRQQIRSIISTSQCLTTVSSGRDSTTTGDNQNTERATGGEAIYQDDIAKEERQSRREEESRQEEEHEIRERILKSSLPFVHQYGWTKKSLSAGAQAEGYPSIAHGMFERGGAELVHYFYSTSNQQLADQLAEQVSKTQAEGVKIKTRPFIRDAVETRLRMLLPYREKWSQAMAIQTLPQNAVESWQNLSRLMDDIWYYAGDRSTDFNWYTKRASLAAVYKSTEIYMIQDNSEDQLETWQFLDRRLDNLTEVSSCARNVQQFGTTMSEGLWGACIMTRNMLGINSRKR